MAFSPPAIGFRQPPESGIKIPRSKPAGFPETHDGAETVLSRNGIDDPHYLHCDELHHRLVNHLILTYGKMCDQRPTEIPIGEIN